MSYQVVVPLVIAKDQNGKLRHVYHGGVIAWLSDEQAKHFLSNGLVVEVDSAAEDSSDGAKPDSEATKAVLIAWLVDNAVTEDGSDYTEAALKPLNKDRLWELVNAVED